MPTDVPSVYVNGHRPKTNGLGQCPDCGLTVHQVAVRRRGNTFLKFLQHDPIPRLRPVADRSRRFCSKCSKPGEWYEFKPGSGECKECMT